MEEAAIREVCWDISTIITTMEIPGLTGMEASTVVAIPLMSKVHQIIQEVFWVMGQIMPM